MRTRTQTQTRTQKSFLIRVLIPNLKDLVLLNNTELQIQFNYIPDLGERLGLHHWQDIQQPSDYIYFDPKVYPDNNRIN